MSPGKKKTIISCLFLGWLACNNCPPKARISPNKKTCSLESLCSVIRISNQLNVLALAVARIILIVSLDDYGNPMTVNMSAIIQPHINTYYLHSILKFPTAPVTVTRTSTIPNRSVVSSSTQTGKVNARVGNNWQERNTCRILLWNWRIESLKNCSAAT